MIYFWNKPLKYVFVSDFRTVGLLNLQICQILKLSDYGLVWRSLRTGMKKMMNVNNLWVPDDGYCHKDFILHYQEEFHFYSTVASATFTISLVKHLNIVLNLMICFTIYVLSLERSHDLKQWTNFKMFKNCFKNISNNANIQILKEPFTIPFNSSWKIDFWMYKRMASNTNLLIGTINRKSITWFLGIQKCTHTDDVTRIDQ